MLFLDFFYFFFLSLFVAIDTGIIVQSIQYPLAKILSREREESFIYKTVYSNPFEVELVFYE